MNSIARFLTAGAAAALLVVGVASAEEKCCVGACEAEGEEKFYSIDDRSNMCGECCMKPEDYDQYHKFEKNLLPAFNGTVYPCADLHYDVYVDTVTHGAGPVQMTLDLYDHSPK